MSASIFPYFSPNCRDQAFHVVGVTCNVGGNTMQGGYASRRIHFFLHTLMSPLGTWWIWVSICQYRLLVDGEYFILRPINAIKDFLRISYHALQFSGKPPVNMGNTSSHFNGIKDFHLVDCRMLLSFICFMMYCEWSCSLNLKTWLCLD